jgi:hypothetical protein
MRNLPLIFILALLTTLPTLSQSATINVPADKPTIQEAINLAVSGDTVLVASGTYAGVSNTNLDFFGKNIVLQSSGGAVATIIDCENVEFRRGLYLHSGENSTAKIIGFTITRGAHRGGGIYCSGSAPIIENCVLSYNYAYDGGAAIRCDSGASITLRNSTLSFNYSGVREKAQAKAGENKLKPSPEVAFGQGGAICVDSGSSAVITSTLFQYNTSDEMGGALYVRFGNLTVDSCTFKDNSVFGSTTGGGALFVDTGGVSTFSNCNFTHNHAGEASGGAILLRKSAPTFSNCIIDSNYCWLGNGGAVKAILGASGAFVKCNFVANYNESGFGGAIYCFGASPSFDTCLIVDNYCSPFGLDGGGGAICADTGSTPQLTHCTVTRNFTTDSLPGAAMLSVASTPIIMNSIVVHNGVGGSIIGPATLSCTDVWGNDGGDWIDSIADQQNISGNLSADPLFCDTANDQFTLLDTSSCLPANNTCGVQMGAFGAGCAYPVIDSIVVDTDGDNLHVLSNTPLIQWSRGDDLGGLQDEFEIAIGTDSNWAFAELWNPAPIVSSDTFLTYAGAPLNDGLAGYMRLRVTAGGRVSDWYMTSFRLNTAPTLPLLLHPANDTVVGTATPICWLGNGTDAENDTLVYDIQFAADSQFASVVIWDSLVSEQADSTSHVVTAMLAENERFYWRARSFDGFETSAWSTFGVFRVNAVDDPPPQVVALWPPDSLGRPVFDMLPLIDWQESVDPDPGDSVTHYKLELSINPAFTFSYIIDSITNTEWEIADSLLFSLEYWWRVRAYDIQGVASLQSEPRNFWTWTLGDFNDSHTCNISDVTFFVNYLFRSGTPVSPRFSADVNGNCAVNISDVTYLVKFLFISGAPLQIGCGPAK